MILTQKFIIIGGAAPIMLRHAAGAETILIRTDDSTVFIGPAGVTILNGFRLSNDITTIPLANNDEIWAVSPNNCIVSILVRT